MIKVNDYKEDQYPLCFRDLDVGSLYENTQGTLVLIVQQGPNKRLLAIKPSGLLRDRAGDNPR